MALLLSALPLQAFAETSEITLLNVNSGKNSDAYKMLAGKGHWQADSSAQFVKLDFRIHPPVIIDRIEIQSCGPSFADAVETYINFDEHRAITEGGKPTLAFTPVLNLPGVQVRALTINFRYNRNTCVGGVKLLKDGKPVKLAVPIAEEKAVSGAVALQDGRLDTHWSPDETAGSVVVKFDNETKVKKLRIWNGDQRSNSLFSSQPRAKTLALIADDQKASVTVKDLKGMQTIDLDNSLKGKSIRVVVESAYDGKPENAKISEMQLGNGDEYFAGEISTSMQANVESRKAGFKTAKLDSVLDRNLVVNEGNEAWAIRVRSDGTIFMRGQSENLNRARTFSYMGSYTIQESTKKGVRIKTSGYYSNPVHEQDSSTCGRECAENPGPEAMFLTDELSFGRGKEGIIFVRDEGSRRARGFEFHSLKARIAKESE